MASSIGLALSSDSDHSASPASFLPIKLLVPVQTGTKPSLSAHEPSDGPAQAEYDHFSSHDTRGRRSYSYPPRAPSTLPRKRSIRNLTAGYVHDEQTSPSRPLSPFRSVKRMKEPFPFRLSNPASPRSKSPLRVQPEDDPMTDSDRPDSGVGMDTTERLKLRIPEHQPKPLLSPIKFSPEPLPGPACCPDPTSAFDDYLGSEGSPTPYPVCEYNYIGPHRRLSYGEPPSVPEASVPEPRLLHRTTGSRELRREAGWLAVDKDCGKWVDDTLSAQATRAYHSEPSRRRRKLWLDLVEDDGEIQEAYAETLTPSPSKPRVISIPRRHTSNAASTSTPPMLYNMRTSRFFPETPPQTPASSIGLGIDPVIEIRLDVETEEQEDYKFQSKALWTMTPPTSTITPPGSGLSTPWSKGTVCLMQPMPMPIPVPVPTTTRSGTPRPGTPTPTPATPSFQLGELTAWILAELESSLSTSSLSSPLQLSSPVITQIRLPPSERRIPRTTITSPASPRPPIFAGPLSSHPSPTQFTPPPNSITTTTTTTTTYFSSPPPHPQTHPSLPALRRIFPFAALPTLHSLLATTLALNHLSTLHLPLPTPSPTSTLPGYIPSKARATLGLHSRPPLPAFWTRPPLPHMAFAARVSYVTGLLERELRRLVAEAMGREGGEEEEALVCRAVREVVRLGEAAEQYRLYRGC